MNSRVHRLQLERWRRQRSWGHRWQYWSAWRKIAVFLPFGVAVLTAIVAREKGVW